MRLLILVFLALLGPLPGNFTTAQAGERLLTIMSYNVHGMILVKNTHDRYAEIGRRLKARREAGTAPEIVVIQEAFQHRTEELVKEAGYPYLLRGPTPKGFRIGSGLIILSEYPLQDGGGYVFRNCGAIDCMARKGVQRGRVFIPGLPWPVTINDAHLNATYDDQAVTWKWTRDARLRQTHELARFYGQDSSLGPAFYAGDFNFQPGDADYQALLQESGAENGARLCTDRPESCRGSAEASAHMAGWIDHVFVSSQGQGQISGALGGWNAEPVAYERTFAELWHGETLSDHLALETTWRITW